MTGRLRHENARKALKPSCDVKAESQERVKQLKRDSYSLDNEFQKYKRKTEHKVSDLEERLKKLRIQELGLYAPVYIGPCSIIKYHTLEEDW